jgi:hypothetical protein
MWAGAAQVQVIGQYPTSGVSGRAIIGSRSDPDARVDHDHPVPEVSRSMSNRHRSLGPQNVRYAFHGHTVIS